MPPFSALGGGKAISVNVISKNSLAAPSRISRWDIVGQNGSIALAWGIYDIDVQWKYESLISLGRVGMRLNETPSECIYHVYLM